METIKDAELSQSQSYRYWLSRIWNPFLGRVCFIGLNPSTADGTIDDATIRRCVDFVKGWGYGGFYMVNLYDYRSTDPKALRTCLQPMSLHCDETIKRCAAFSDLVVFAWGNQPGILIRSRQVASWFPGALCFGKTKDGQPKHPLYLKKDCQLIKYS